VVSAAGEDDLGFEDVHRALLAWPAPLAAPTEISSVALRLLQAARTAVEDAAGVGVPDLAVLVRHLLRAEAERTGASKWLPVPRERPWPQRAEWAAYGMSSIDATEAQHVFADPWLPNWLTGDGADPATHALRGEHRSPIGDPELEPADPFLTHATGLRHYRSAGQRETIRAVLTTPPNATIVGNLPTGSGKSLAGYVQALIARNPGTTVVVIPTTSLAIDQERAFRELVAQHGQGARFPGRLSYYGELAESSRAEIRRKLADGTQGILFTSPESLITSLSSALYAAAGRGLLRTLVIDEAHIVSQWGAEFRPAFQALAGVRNDLLTTAAAAGAHFRTVLLSATLTSESIFTLQRLFGHPGPTELISAVTLRDEPGYWVAASSDAETRAARVLDSIRHLPRPLILYTTKVADAKQWRDRLLDAGFRRVMLVAGETSANERAEAIRRLRDGSLDLVVATSAFGLGVDQPDVRAVVHACLPETIDRFYQEVGRGGRDGRPSVSMLLSAPSDARIADGLAHTKLISLDRGFERWSEMQTHGSAIGDGRIKLPLDVSPPDLFGDSGENRAWNLRTLLLMSRGGLLSLEATAPPRRAETESEEAWEARAPEAFDSYAAHVVVRLNEGGLAHREVWDGPVGPARNAARAADGRARGRMDEALRPRTQLCRLFTSTYTVEGPIPGIADAQLPIRVGCSCGGCPGCRARGLPARSYPAPPPRPAVTTDQTWHPAFEPWFAGEEVLVATYRIAEDWTDNVIRGLERLTRRGMWCLLAPEEITEQDAVRQLHRHAVGDAIFQLQRWNSLWPPVLPTALVIGPDESVLTDYLRPVGPRRVLIVSDDARDPRHPTGAIREYHQPVTAVRDLIERL
jgi:superfamily II DNA helicase RecQ